MPEVIAEVSFDESLDLFYVASRVESLSKALEALSPVLVKARASDRREPQAFGKIFKQVRPYINAVDESDVEIEKQGLNHQAGSGPCMVPMLGVPTTAAAGAGTGTRTPSPPASPRARW